MTEQDRSSAQALAELRQMITDARPVPMSSSCMVSRADALALVDVAEASLPRELDAARTVLSNSSDEVARGREEADAILREARAEAERLASQTEVVRRAQQQAAQLLADARSECEALRAETDGYVDTRMAEFEAVLARTGSQVRTMRQRLAERRPAVVEDDDTITLPRL